MSNRPTFRSMIRNIVREEIQNLLTQEITFGEDAYSLGKEATGTRSLAKRRVRGSRRVHTKTKGRVTKATDKRLKANRELQ